MKFKDNLKNKRSFKESWKIIINQANSKKSEDSESFIYNQYFDELLLYQDLLTDTNNILNADIDYSNYVSIMPNHFKSNTLYECFHGVLNYIYKYSNNRFNTNELEFHYSGSNLLQNTSYRNKIQNDIINIFDYENPNKSFIIGCCKNAFFGVKFKRILIYPVSYSIRSSILSIMHSNLVSFTFEGFNEIENKWDILDERDNTNDLNTNGAFNMFYVKKTDKYYSSFRIRQTNVGSNDFWGFSISAFDIHGMISYKDYRFDYENNIMQFEDIYDDLNFFQYDSF